MTKPFRIATLILALTLAASLFGCAQTPDAPSPEPSASPSEPSASPSDSTHTAEPSPAEEPIPVEVGGRLVLGEYSGEPIEWRILDIADGKALVISEEVLTVRMYNGDFADTNGDGYVDQREVDAAGGYEAFGCTWETSDIRSWLNDDFYDSSFTAAERSEIVQTTITNPDNLMYGTPGGNDTNDNVFLLSVDEAKNYFSNAADRVAYYRVAESVAWFWLRSPGYYDYFAAGVGDFGYVVDSLNGVYGISGVHPAMWVTL